MNLLLVSEDKKSVTRFKNLCDQLSLSFHHTSTGYDALSLVQVTPFRIVVVSDGLSLVKSEDVIRKLQHQHQPYLVYAYLQNYDIRRLGRLLAAGNDRWISTSQPDAGLVSTIQPFLNGNLDFLEVEHKRFHLEKKFGINNLIGSSQRSTQLYRDIERTIGTDISIIIQGASGCGKELVTRLIHYTSPRAERKLVSMNCAAVPRDLMESELFGFEKGAFTGAQAQKKGKFEYADKGTLFLDEIADMDLTLQSKILRVLEQKEFERIGSNETLKTDVRILSASNKELKSEMHARRFRLDLYYRLNNYTIEVPALAERKDDILPLTVYFLQKLNQKNLRQITAFERGVIDRLQNYSWPGNVREFENVLVHALLYTDDGILRATTIDQILDSKTPLHSALQAGFLGPGNETIIPLKALEKKAILQALQQTDGNVSRTARKLGVSRVTIWRKIEKYGLKAKIKASN